MDRQFDHLVYENHQYREQKVFGVFQLVLI